MAITTMAGLVAGLKPAVYIQKTSAGADTDTPTTNFYVAGSPIAATAPSPGIDGASLTSYAGQIDFQNPASGNAYLAGLTVSGLGVTASAIDGYWQLYDRLWHNSAINITTTTEQAISSTAWPARDVNGSTNGEGVFVAIEVSTGSSATGVANTTLNYTNSAGTSGRTATLPTIPNTPNSGSLLMFNLQAGDTGIRSVQGLTLGTSWTAGTIHLVAVRPIAMVVIPGIGSACQFRDVVTDALALGMPRLYDNSVLMMVGYSPSQLSMPQTAVTITYAHG